MDDPRLSNLLNYTVFHIGVYITLGTAFIGASVFGAIGGCLVKWCVACFFVAGICGGVIGSNIPDHQSFDSYQKQKIGFWGLRVMPYSTWAKLEHLAFWLGNTPLAVGFLVLGSNVFKW